MILIFFFWKHALSMKEFTFFSQFLGVHHLNWAPIAHVVAVFYFFFLVFRTFESLKSM